MSLLHSNAGHVSVLKWLNAKGDIFLTDRLGGTPLHDAAEQGQFEVGTVQLRKKKTVMQAENAYGIRIYMYSNTCTHTTSLKCMNNELYYYCFF